MSDTSMSHVKWQLFDGRRSCQSVFCPFLSSKNPSIQKTKSHSYLCFRDFRPIFLTLLRKFPVSKLVCLPLFCLRAKVKITIIIVEPVAETVIIIEVLDFNVFFLCLFLLWSVSLIINVIEIHVNICVTSIHW